MLSFMTRHGARTLLLMLACAATAGAYGADLSGTVRRPSVAVKGQADFSAATVGTLKRNDPVKVAAQQGLWYRIAAPGGFVRVNDVRLSTSAGAEQAMAFSARSGKGRVSESASVRGLGESELKSAAFDGAQLSTMQGYRATAQAAASAARAKGWDDTAVAWSGEAVHADAARNTSTRSQKRSGLSAMRGALSQLGLGGMAGNTANSALDVADAGATKSEAEQTEEELQLGPEIAGRVLGAAPLWNNPEAQRRVNLLGRWVASHSARPNLPWTFGVIDVPEVNAFAAPGGYVLVTRGLYELAAGDDELAGALAHEVSHIVERDHYNVIRKQAMTAAGTSAVTSRVSVGAGIADGYLRDYLNRFGASVLAARLDRSAEYRSDEAAGYYAARSGLNPLGLYAVLQRMSALGAASSRMRSLDRTHPGMGERLDRLDQRGLAPLERYTARE